MLEACVHCFCTGPKCTFAYSRGYMYTLSKKLVLVMHTFSGEIKTISFLGLAVLLVLGVVGFQRLGLECRPEQELLKRQCIRIV